MPEDHLSWTSSLQQLCQRINTLYYRQLHQAYVILSKDKDTI